MYVSIFVALVLVLLITTADVFVYAGGPRLDWPEDSTSEGKDCWVEGYDAGFAGRYDKDRADQCALEDDEYNRSWDGACESFPRSEQECTEIMNNPVYIEGHEALQQENKSDCYYDGYEDGKADNPFNKDRASGCSEYGGRYRDGYQFGCQIDSTESSCELLIEGHERYCPNHPDITACVEFLYNATNKGQGQASTDVVCAQPFVTCLHESNPEKYCMNTNDPVFCKTIGDLCDEDGFVKPEYPYCTVQVK